jgi:catechol 2,3-dioxygenase-like lactoylglutathione lyase family enzyme
MNPKSPVLRVGRPTDDIDALLPFYVSGLGFEILYRFEDHDGFDGVMIGHRGQPYHLEFARRHGHTAGRAPTRDNLLVFYLPERSDYEAALARMAAAGFAPVVSYNPFWDDGGKTFEDPDGYRVVLYNAAWSR